MTQPQSTPLHTWARACFEQRSLPSLSALPGKASLPSSICSQRSMSTCGTSCMGTVVLRRRCLTVCFLWPSVDLASAMVGSTTGPPMWIGEDWRPILGTPVREEQLLLSLWVRTPEKELSIFHAVNTWLSAKKDIPVDAGPDCIGSPHSPESPMPHDLWHASYFAPLFQSYTPDQYADVLLTFRVMVETMSLDSLRKLNSILLGGSAPASYNRSIWLVAVRGSFNMSPLEVGARHCVGCS